MHKQIIKNSLYLLLMTLISLLLIWVGIMTINDNYSRDINDVERLDGEIERTEIILSSKRAGAIPSVNMKLRFLKIGLKNSSERLFTYNAKQDYYELMRTLKKGLNVTAYYKKLKENEVTNNVYRLDLGETTILTHDDYKEKEYFAGIVMVIFGLFVLIIAGFMLKKKGLKKNWG